MIKTIIKRDGTEQPFDPAKLNHWGEWAADGLTQYVDWSYVVMHSVTTIGERVSSQQLQERLIKTCLDMNGWSYNLFAGKLYASYLYKGIFDDKLPTVKEQHQRMVAIGIMRDADFTDEEYAFMESIIDHKRDFDAPHFSLHHIREKYSLKNRITGQEYETQQFVYMRMAMGLAATQPKSRRMDDLKAWYNHFSMKRINAPTPNYVNLCTMLAGYASCCLYTTLDSAASLAIGDHIAYTMTYMSAGIGNHINSRGKGDPVRGGLIRHQGRLPYYRALVGAVKANLQNGRGGAATTYFNCFDPEIETILMLKNPMSTEDKKINGIDYAMSNCRFFARKAARKEKIFTFNSFTAPDLYQAMYSKDPEDFVKLYEKYEADESFVKNYVNAREMILVSLNEANDTGRAYLHQVDECNRHTPFIDTIYSSNLCTEISEPTYGYEKMIDLYTAHEIGHIHFKDELGNDHVVRAEVKMREGSVRTSAIDLIVGDVLLSGHVVTEIIARTKQPEVAMCNIAALVVSNIHSEEMYADAMYYAQLMADKCIHMAEYALPHVGFTAKQRLSIGIGVMGVAHYMARGGFSFSSIEGKKEIHRIAERHMWHSIESGIRIGKELGNAPWMHKTLWPQGYLPLDTYCKAVDGIADFENMYPWDDTRAKLIENKGMRYSCVVTHMPGEASSKGSATTNSLLPIRDLNLLKSDNSIIVYWSAPDSELLKDAYELAWDIPTFDMIDNYAIWQKWTDQGISADLYRKLIGDDTISSTTMLNEYFYLVKMGLKGRYYQNAYTGDADGNITYNTDAEAPAACGAGGCSL
jgi:ribonucleoside-diphosphate reductase alpha chain